MKLPAPQPHRPPTFDPSDPKAMEFLDEQGYCVFSNIANEEQIAQGRSLAWDYLENLPNFSIDRNQPKTWENFPDRFGKGIIMGDNVGQSSFTWFCRGLPRVSKIFEAIWKDAELITSFDGFGFNRPAEYNAKWATKGGWYHLDQNGVHKPNKCCVQGLLNFYPSGPTDGGIVVVPRSHMVFNKIFERRPQLDKGPDNDFIMLSNSGPTSIWQQEFKEHKMSPVKVCLEPGEFIVWDSRLVHCNCPATTLREMPKDGSVLPPRRLVSYICMLPKSRANQNDIQKRVQAFYQGHTTTHWPAPVNIPGARKGKSSSFVPPSISADAAKLIPLSPDALP